MSKSQTEKIEVVSVEYKVNGKRYIMKPAAGGLITRPLTTAAEGDCRCGEKKCVGSVTK